MPALLPDFPPTLLAVPSHVLFPLPLMPFLIQPSGWLLLSFKIQFKYPVYPSLSSHPYHPGPLSLLAWVCPTLCVPCRSVLRCSSWHSESPFFTPSQPWGQAEARPCSLYFHCPAQYLETGKERAKIPKAKGPIVHFWVSLVVSVYIGSHLLAFVLTAGGPVYANVSKCGR